MAGRGDPQHGSSGPIQLIPPGLLGLLQLKNRGANPSQLLDSYQPIVEMFHWLLQAEARRWPLGQIAVATGNGDAVFSPNHILVPQDEWWYVHHYSIEAAMGAGDNVGHFVPHWREGNTPVHFYALDTGLAINLTRNGRMISGAQSFFLPPGAELGFTYVCTAATTITFNGYVWYTPLPI